MAVTTQWHKTILLDGLARAVCQHLDGSRTIDEIVALVKEKLPLSGDITAEDAYQESEIPGAVERILGQFVENALLVS